MTTQSKNTVRQFFNTNYGQEMLQIHGLKMVKKEIFHAIKNQEGDKRQSKFYIND
tara:strand:+ start:188 stop:352 length:165 start_codon:yes stop_codon:yes gene_type:complete